MTRAELEKRLEWLEEREFYLEMVDRFTREDREALETIREEKEKIKIKAKFKNCSIRNRSQKK